MNETEKTTPWWATLVAAIVASILSVTATVIFMRGGVSIPTGTAAAVPSSSIVTDTLSYIPHILLLFGVLADMFTYEGVYSIPSLIGLLSIPVNFAFQYFWKGIDTIMTTANTMATTPASSSAPKPSAPPSSTVPKTIPTPVRSAVGGGQNRFIGYTGCEVQGFGGLNSDFAPQTLVVTATIFSYYIFDLLNNRGTTSAVGSIVIGLVVFLGQAFAIDFECFKKGRLSSMIRAAAEGMFNGGVAYSVVQSYYPNRLPSSVISGLKSANPKDLSTGADGKLYDSSGRRFVMMDGQAVPDTCGAGSNGSSSDGTSTGGAGTAASSSSCRS